ncbi:hypothetical protein GIB67_037487, partial [Kingdonia uniflora]
MVFDVITFAWICLHFVIDLDFEWFWSNNGIELVLNTILRCMAHYNLFDNLQLSGDDSNIVDTGNNSSSNASSKKKRDIGFQVRMHLPIIYESFNDVPNDRIALVVKGLEECYDISHVAWFDLKEKLEMLGKEKFLAKSKRNKENRAKLIAPCTLGRTSMPITLHKLAEERGVTDEEIGRVEVYIPAHTKKDKTIQCPDVIAELQNTMRNDPKSIRIGPNDAIAQKFGKERKGGTRDMGAGMSISLMEKMQDNYGASGYFLETGGTNKRKH